MPTGRALVAREFGPYRFNLKDGTLTRGGEYVPLTGKAASLLRCLLENAGSWVPKAAIMAAVWPDTHVQPDNIKVLIRELRQALGDEFRHATFIRSAPGRGYAFIASVTPAAAPAAHRQPRAAIFVNRGPELAALANALDAARASAHRLVLLVGEHGAGKTALCDAFVRTAQAGGLIRACHGQCFDRAAPHEPYYPFIDALMALDRRHPGLVPRVLAEHAPSWLAQFPQWGGTGTPAGHALRTFDELCAALAALSHDVPLVLVLEDIQWADEETLNALARMTDSHAPAKLLILATCCEGEWSAGVRPQMRLTALANEHSHSITLALGSLTPEHVARYLDARFGPDCLSDLAAGLHQATGGNPFMLVTAVDSLVARGLVAEERGAWRRTAPLETIADALPDSLGELIARQVEQLDPAERETLEAAAAVGIEFTTSTVAAALAQTVDFVGRRLAPLARRGQLIVSVGPAGSAGSGATSGRAGALGASGGAQPVYRFRHPLYADVLARQAPALRQLKITERLSRAEDMASREQSRKRA